MRNKVYEEILWLKSLEKCTIKYKSAKHMRNLNKEMNGIKDGK